MQPPDPTEHVDQLVMAHRLPDAPVVDRIPFLVDVARDRRVVHVGFADAGFRQQNRAEGRWVHEHLADAATSIVGIDLDADGVTEARADGYAAERVDCCDVDAVRRLGLEPADVVVAGEIIEHVDAPGPFLDGLRELCRPDGMLVLTTPNAYGWINPLASLAGYEVNHPDHVVMFTWRTLSTLMARHGWRIESTHVFLPRANAANAGPGRDRRARAMAGAASAVLAVQRVVARARPFVADGLIFSARPD